MWAWHSGAVGVVKGAPVAGWVRVNLRCGAAFVGRNVEGDRALPDWLHGVVAADDSQVIGVSQLRFYSGTLPSALELEGPLTHNALSSIDTWRAASTISLREVLRSSLPKRSLLEAGDVFAVVLRGQVLPFKVVCGGCMEGELHVRQPLPCSAAPGGVPRLPKSRAVLIAGTDALLRAVCDQLAAEADGVVHCPLSLLNRHFQTREIITALRFWRLGTVPCVLWDAGDDTMDQLVRACVQSGPQVVAVLPRADLVSKFDEILSAAAGSPCARVTPDAATGPVADLELDTAPLFRAELAELRRIVVRPLAQKGDYERFGVVSPPRALVTGPSGSGKSTLVRAALAGVPHLVVPAREIVSKYVGEAEERLRDAFARAPAPGVLILDGIDELVLGQQSYTQRFVAAMLLALDSVATEENVGVIATSCRPKAELDARLTRPGRLSEEVLLPAVVPLEDARALATWLGVDPLKARAAPLPSVLRELRGPV